LTIPGSKATGGRPVNLTEEGTEWFAFLADGRKLNDWLLVDDAGKQWTTWWAGRLMRKVRKDCGLRDDAVLYCARHTVATAAIYNGRPDVLTARQLGTSVRMLEINYVEALEGRGHRTSLTGQHRN
jgi:hypothetical protein